MGDVWGHVGLGMGPILITPESIFMALEPKPGMPGAVPIGGRCPVQSKSSGQHKADSSRIPALRIEVKVDNVVLELLDHTRSVNMLDVCIYF